MKILGEPVSREDFIRAGIVWSAATGACTMLCGLEFAIADVAVQRLAEALSLFVFAPLTFLLAVFIGSRGDRRHTEDLLLALALICRRLPNRAKNLTHKHCDTPWFLLNRGGTTYCSLISHHCHTRRHTHW